MHAKMRTLADVLRARPDLPVRDAMKAAGYGERACRAGGVWHGSRGAGRHIDPREHPDILEYWAELDRLAAEGQAGPPESDAPGATAPDPDALPDPLLLDTRIRGRVRWRQMAWGMYEYAAWKARAQGCPKWAAVTRQWADLLARAEGYLIKDPDDVPLRVQDMTPRQVAQLRRSLEEKGGDREESDETDDDESGSRMTH